MATKTQKIKLGIFLIGGGLLFMLMLGLFAGAAFWKKTDHYHVLVPDSVNGVDIGSSVLLRGVSIGRVAEMELHPERDYQSVRLTLEVDDDVPIAKDSEASLMYKGVTGLKVVNIEGGTREAGPLPPGSYIEYGETAIDKLTKEAERLIAQASELISTTNQLMTHLVTASQRVDLERVDTILRRFEGMAENLSRASAELDTMVSENRRPLNDAIVSARETLEQVELVAGQAENAVEGLNGVAGEIRGVVRSNDDELRATMNNLQEATRSFRHLGRELRRRPSRLLFSKPPPKRELP